MSIPLAAVGAVVVALLEVSVFPELTIAGVKPDLIFIFSVTATMMIGIEVGLTWAFVGGLLLDLLTPGRQLGPARWCCFCWRRHRPDVARFLPQRRVLVATGAVFVLAWRSRSSRRAMLGATTGLDPMLSWPSVLSTALVDAAIALPVAAIDASSSGCDYGVTDRIDW